jgi:hypothetical protein
VDDLYKFYRALVIDIQVVNVQTKQLANPVKCLLVALVGALGLPLQHEAKSFQGHNV